MYNVIKNKILYDNKDMKRIKIKIKRDQQTALIKITVKSYFRF